MHRVLKPVRKGALSVWQTPTPGNGFGILYSSISAYVDINAGLSHGPDFFQFSGGDKLGQAQINHGFCNPSISTVIQI